jgi:hypothetical protein
MLQELQSILFSAIGAVLTAVITWATQRLIIWLNSKIKNEKSAKIMEQAVNIVANAVKSTYQTYVESLKNINAFTKEAQITALNNAIGQTKALLTKDMIKLINNTYGNLEEWINLKIESTIYDLKNKTSGDAK